jgi:hypothetical protein
VVAGSNGHVHGYLRKVDMEGKEVEQEGQRHDPLTSGAEDV